MRYGRLKAEVGPGGGPPVIEASLSGLGDAAATLGEGEGALVIGGGSMDDCDATALVDMKGSGKAGISSSVDEVSIVICLVGGVLWRNV